MWVVTLECREVINNHSGELLRQILIFIPRSSTGGWGWLLSPGPVKGRGSQGSWLTEAFLCKAQLLQVFFFFSPLVFCVRIMSLLVAKVFQWALGTWWLMNLQNGWLGSDTDSEGLSWMLDDSLTRITVRTHLKRKNLGLRSFSYKLAGVPKICGQVNPSQGLLQENQKLPSENYILL